MSVEVLTILMFITLMASIALGHPLAVTLAAVATVFGLIDNGFDVSALLGLFANNAWGIFLNYTLVAIPLFIFMAQILDRSKVSEGLFDALYQVLGGLRGGLGMAVIVVSTVFAATTGIIGASVVAMGLMAGPALLRRGYNRGLGAGIICASGTLGILIPPSIMLVVYGGLTGQKETSVGTCLLQRSCLGCCCLPSICSMSVCAATSIRRWVRRFPRKTVPQPSLKKLP